MNKFEKLDPIERDYHNHPPQYYKSEVVTHPSCEYVMKEVTDHIDRELERFKKEMSNILELFEREKDAKSKSQKVKKKVSKLHGKSDKPTVA